MNHPLHIYIIQCVIRMGNVISWISQWPFGSDFWLLRVPHIGVGGPLGLKSMDHDMLVIHLEFLFPCHTVTYLRSLLLYFASRYISSSQLIISLDQFVLFRFLIYVHSSY